MGRIKRVRRTLNTSRLNAEPLLATLDDDEVEPIAQISESELLCTTGVFEGSAWPSHGTKWVRARCRIG